jgi:hypothetical protein
MAAAILVVTGVIFAFAGSPASTPIRGSAPVGGGSGAGEGVWANCTQQSSTTCGLAPAGESWSLGPISSWCTQNEAGSYICASQALILSFTEATNSTLHGVLSVQGASQVWVIPAVDGCDLMGALSHFDWSCAPSIGYVPPLSWNATFHSGYVDLSSFAFSLNGTTGVLPPFTWAVCIADLEPSPVEVSSVTALTVVAA